MVSDANEMEDVFAEDDSEEESETEGKGEGQGRGLEQGRARGRRGEGLWQAPFSPPPPPSPPPPSPSAGSSYLGDLDVLEVAALDEIDAGALEGMFSDDFAKVMGWGRGYRGGGAGADSLDRDDVSCENIGARGGEARDCFLAG